MQLDPQNLIHLLLAKDIPGEDKYARAGKDFTEWIEKGALIADKSPAIYFYSQEYSLKGEKKTRLGFIALLKLTEKGAGIFKHEFTRAEPKEDRLKLLRRVKANLSPIFGIFPDKKRIIQQTCVKYIEDKVPFIDIEDQDKIRHKLWRIDEPRVLEAIQDKISDENIFIADGHHRYEVACLYREEMRKKLGKLSGDESFNYILTYFTNTRNRGLTILPINRLVKLNKDFDFRKFHSDLSDYFIVEEVKDRVKFFFLMQKAAGTEHIIGMYKDKRFWLLRLKNVLILDKVVRDKGKDYRALDVTVLNYLVLQRALGMDIEDKTNIIYCHDPEELIGMQENNSDSIVFFLNPARIEQIMAVALGGERMPSKSTFFYPKVLSGLVINKF